MANQEDRDGATGGGTSGTGGIEGPTAKGQSGGGGQGDDLADALGGSDSRAGMSGAGAETGDMSAGRSEGPRGSGAGAGGPGGGDPGGMGGIATRGSESTAGGGVSPIQKDTGGTDSRH